MNASDYVVIPKSVLEEIEKELNDKPWILFFESNYQPLAPIIDKARGEGFDAGGAYATGSHKDFKQIHPNKKDFLKTEFEI